MEPTAQSAPRARHEGLRHVWSIASSREVRRIAIRASISVGTLLNFVNQGQVMLADVSAVRPLPLLLTYVVPYCVSTYTATVVTLRRRT